ncbi:Mitochondrial-processing peptidase subunit alpha [Tulasnella sp. JGI-2019a]|nr:Mitochondrial-processing peptidase subunit alpha [Tulasnella sp. JGI-2019a]
MKRALRTTALRSRAAVNRAAPRRTFVNPAGPSKEVLPVDITTLPNGVRVVTEPTPGYFSSVGVYIDAGSRYESPRLSGSSHIMDRMAFKTTSNRTAEEMSTGIDSLGGQVVCSSSRETIMYQSSHFHAGTPLAVSLLADTILRPSFLPSEVSDTRDAAAYEIREITSKPEMIMPELLHQVAYQGNTLGNPLLCPEDRLEKVDANVLREYVDTWYRPERMVVAGAGMPHAQLVDLAHEHFGELKAKEVETPQPVVSPTASPSAGASRSTATPTHLLPPPSSLSPSLYKTITTAATSLFNPAPVQNPTSLVEPSFAELANMRARYTGGHQFFHQLDMDMTHVYLGFDGLSIHDEDIYALATVQILLGGGGSFSAGGPGKGMYSRLYTHVLNHHSSIDHCSSFHHIYTDTSLFGLALTAHPHHSPSNLLPLLAHQLSLLLYHPIPLTELTRAKNQLMSSLMMALESRIVEVEDLGRQILVHGRKVSVQEMCDKIVQVNGDDVRRVMRRVVGEGMKVQPTVLVMGRQDVAPWEGVFKKYGLGRL